MAALLTRPRSLSKSLAMAVAAAVPQWPALQTAVLHLIHSLVPRILLRNHGHAPKKLHPTSYLDALRGYAAFFVINHHQFALEDTWFVNLPIIRLVRSGLGMVEIFFVISGYVLSIRVLSLARQRKSEGIFNSLSSAIFRRWLRLYLPTFIALLLVAVLRFFDLYEPTKDKNARRTMYKQVRDYFVDAAMVSNPFGAVGFYMFPRNFDYANSRFLHILWTIPTEFRASIIVYCFLAATCRMPTMTRMTLCVCGIITSYYYTAIYSAMFLSGVFLADLSLTRNTDTHQPSPASPPQISEKPSQQTVSKHMKVIYSLAIFTSLIVLSFPTETPWTFYYPWPLVRPHLPTQYLGNVELRKQFFPSFGAPLLIWALDSWNILQIPFTWNFSQYLGEISFGIYLMHIPVIWTLQGNIFEPLRKAYLGDSLWAFVPQMILLRLAVLWAAEVFTHVDKRCVAFARWAEGRLFAW